MSLVLEMTDDLAVRGPFRAVECEWTDPVPCLKPVQEHKAYCPDCMKLAYQPAKKKTNAKR